MKENWMVGSFLQRRWNFELDSQFSKKWHNGLGGGRICKAQSSSNSSERRTKLPDEKCGNSFSDLGSHLVLSSRL